MARILTIWDKTRQMTRLFEKKTKPYSVVSRTHPKSPLLLYRSCTINPLESKQDTPIIELHYMAKVKEFYRYSNSKSADFE